MHRNQGHPPDDFPVPLEPLAVETRSPLAIPLHRSPRPTVMWIDQLTRHRESRFTASAHTCQPMRAKGSASSQYMAGFQQRSLSGTVRADEKVETLAKFESVPVQISQVPGPEIKQHVLDAFPDPMGSHQLPCLVSSPRALKKASHGRAREDTEKTLTELLFPCVSVFFRG